MALLVRYAAAIIGAALTAALMAGLLAGQANLVFFAFIVALAHAFVLGLPVALVFQRLGWLNLFAAVAAGFVIGALPLGVFFALSPPAHFESVAAVPTAIEGRRTLAGWIGILQSAGMLGLHGALGGLAAWLIWRGSRRAPWACGAAVIVLAAVVMASPALLMDRSCHNPLRDGRSSIGPELRASLPIAPGEWPRLAELFQSFADSTGWSFRNSSTRSPVAAIDLSVCSAQGTQIWALQQIWPNPPAFEQERGVSIVVYQPQGGLSWQEPARRLLLSIETRWPGKLTYRDEMGRDTPPPDFLKPPETR